MSNPLWLRCEKKQFERRAAITPTTAKRLIDAGYSISVERDEQRIFDDKEYEVVGCTLVPNSSWPCAPLNTPIIGLKELVVSSEPLQHTHIHFAHCYKRQAGWSSVLSRFHAGQGTLYDLEFLQDENGRRVAAFGFHAGFAGAAAGALAYAALKEGKPLGALEPFQNEREMISRVKSSLNASKNVKALVIGALGRCGRGAVDLLQKVGLEDSNILKWDLDETAKGGPFQEILDVDIFMKEAGVNRRLSVIVDVSCDTTNPYNPIPLYNVNTTFNKPTVSADVGPGNPPLHIVSIDHLPTLLPREASEQFSHDLLPSLLQLKDRTSTRVWVEAEKLFREKLAEAIKEEGTNPNGVAH